MDKFSVNDWLTLQTRKDLTYIRRDLEHGSINHAIFADLFIALFAFVMDHVLWTIVDPNTGAVEQATPSLYWIGTAVLLIIVPAIIFLCNYLKRNRYQADVKMVMPVDYLVDLFDNEICYNVMTADSMRDHMLNANGSIREEIQKFYYIEALYYANKATTQLYHFKNQGQKAIQTSTSFEGVAYVRFQNVCEIVFMIYKELVAFAINDRRFLALIEDSKEDIDCFNDLVHYMGAKIDELNDMTDWKVETTTE